MKLQDEASIFGWQMAATGGGWQAKKLAGCLEVGAATRVVFMGRDDRTGYLPSSLICEILVSVCSVL